MYVRSESLRANTLDSKMSIAFPRGFQLLNKHWVVFTVPLNFLPYTSSKITLKIFFSTFVDERSESQKKRNLKMKTDKNLLSTDQSIFFFYKPACLQKKFHRRALSICAFFLRWVLWEDSVSLLMKS